MGMLVLIGCVPQQKEQNSQKVVDENSECIEKVKVLIPEIITLYGDKPLRFSSLDNPKIIGFRNHCELRKGFYPGENTNRYYGGCSLSFRSEKIITDTGDILPPISFDISIEQDDLTYIPENDRYRIKETILDIDVPLKDFKVEKVNWLSCSGADNPLFEIKGFVTI